MKLKFSMLTFLALGILFIGCKKDNYESPSSLLRGAIMFKGDTIPVSYNDVTFQLWEGGWGKLTPIDVFINQNGSFSVSLFNGDYKLVIVKGQGPFTTLTNPVTSSDTMLVHVQGDQNLNIEVLPYVMIRNPQFSVTPANAVVANIRLERIVTTLTLSDIQTVALYLSKTAFVDARTSISTTSVTGTAITDLNNINLSTAVPVMIPTQNYVFARVGVKIRNVEDMIYSPIVKMPVK